MKDEEEGIELNEINDLLLEVKENEELKSVDPELALKNQKSIYNIYSEQKRGICFFCEIQDPDEKDKIIKVLFSCYHVIAIDHINEVKIFSDKEEKKIEIDPKERRIWYDEEMDYACIEILEKDNISNYLNVFNDINDKKYENEYIENKLLYASNTKSISPGKGQMKQYKLIYSFDTEDGWSGAPVFLSGDNKVIGIHRGGINNKINKKKERFNLGIPIKYILMNMKIFNLKLKKEKVR